MDDQSTQNRRDATGRDKLQLSCNACRKRKVRCDRQVPCSNCSIRGLSASCTYSTRPKLGRPRAHVQDRIDHLESLVLGLMRRQQQPDTPLDTHSDRIDHLRASVAVSVDVDVDVQAEDEVQNIPIEARPEPSGAQDQRQASPTSSEHGTIHMRESGPGYSSSTHWQAILDSITELKQHAAVVDPSPYPIPQQHASVTVFDPDTQPLPRPRLFYGCRDQTSVASILQAMPTRPIVDRLVSRYFNDLDMATGIVHRVKFVREYECFWQAPASVNIMWLGQLFAIMCLSSQYQQMIFSSDTPASSKVSPSQASELAIGIFQTKSAECLILGQYTEGGPYVVETLILHLLSEIFPLKEINVGIWMLVGTIVQVAMHMGLHRDPANFPNKITPFAGEMRRRVWSMVAQIDFSISTQLGLPRLISQENTTEPRNLFDSDFDETIAELPPSRPETEVTPILYTLAKLRILSVGTEISDLITKPGTHPYNEVLNLDQQLNEAMESLPSSMKWKGLSSSLTATPLVLIQRIWLDMCFQRLKTVLHRRFLAPSFIERQQYAYSRSTCLTAAMKTLEFQHLIDEETRPDGRLYQIRWRISTAVTQEFLLATSILCLYLQTRVQDHEQRPQTQQRPSTKDAESALHDRIRQLLQKSLGIWLRLSADSSEARRAFGALDYVLRGSEPFLVQRTVSGSSPAPLIFQDFVQKIHDYDTPGTVTHGVEDRVSWDDLVCDPDNITAWVGDVASQHIDLFSL